MTTTAPSAGLPRLRITGPTDAFWRVCWALLGVFCGAFGLFEMTAHGSPTVYTFFIGAIGPDVALLAQPFTKHEKGQLYKWAVPVYNTLHFPLIPFAVVLFYSLNNDTNVQAAPWFTLGITWLAHIAFDRMLGYGLRRADGWQRGGWWARVAGKSGS
jgi:hypothetical protein